MKTLLIILISFILGSFILAAIFLPPSPEVTHQVFRMNDYYMCKYDDGEWTRENEFTVNEDIFVCFNFSTTEEWDSYPITYRVYKREISGEFLEVFNESTNVKNKNCRIQLFLDSVPGSYSIEVYSIRHNLFNLSFVVVE